MTPAPSTAPLRVLTALLLLTSLLSANPREARDMARALAGGYAQKGFVTTPTSHAGVLGGGGQDAGQSYLIPVVKGFDYVLLVGTDQGALVVNVYDETDNAILEGRPAGKMSGVQFRAAYNGTARVHVYVARSSDRVNYHVLQLSRATSQARSVTVRAAVPAANAQQPLPDTVDDLHKRMAGLPMMAVRSEKASLPAKLDERFHGQMKELTGRGYSFSPDEHTYRCESKSYTRILVPVTRGVSYAVVACANSSTGPIHGYVHDEAGTFLTRDTYSDRQFTIPFVATYNGTAVVYIEVTDVDSIGQINVSIGRRFMAAR